MKFYKNFWIYFRGRNLSAGSWKGKVVPYVDELRNTCAYTQGCVCVECTIKNLGLLSDVPKLVTALNLYQLCTLEV